MIETYLSKYREEEPEWIEKYLRGEQITFRDVMSSRVGYFPDSGDEGTLVKVGNKSHSVHSFLYVDTMRRMALDNCLSRDGFRGYHLVGQIEWQKNDLLPNGEYKYPSDIERYYSPRIKNTILWERPFCFSQFMERDEDKDDTWGAKHFVVTFLYADGIATYYQLFVREYKKVPWLFLLFNRWGLSLDRGGKLNRVIKVFNMYPPFVLCSTNSHIWENYKKVDDVSPVFGTIHNYRRDLYIHLSDTNIE